MPFTKEHKQARERKVKTMIFTFSCVVSLCALFTSTLWRAREQKTNNTRQWIGRIEHAFWLMIFWITHLFKYNAVWVSCEKMNAIVIWYKMACKRINIDEWLQMMMTMMMNMEFFLCELLNHGLWMILDFQAIVMKEDCISLYVTDTFQYCLLHFKYGKFPYIFVLKYSKQVLK